MKKIFVTLIFSSQFLLQEKRGEKKKEIISPFLLSVFLGLTMCCFLFPYSIEFDRDFDYFAIAGVTKKIKVLYVKETNLFFILLSGDIKEESLFFTSIYAFINMQKIFLVFTHVTPALETVAIRHFCAPRV